MRRLRWFISQDQSSASLDWLQIYGSVVIETFEGVNSHGRGVLIEESTSDKNRAPAQSKGGGLYGNDEDVLGRRTSGSSSGRQREYSFIRSSRHGCTHRKRLRLTSTYIERRRTYKKHLLSSNNLLRLRLCQIPSFLIPVMAHFSCGGDFARAAIVSAKAMRGIPLAHHFRRRWDATFL